MGELDLSNHGVTRLCVTREYRKDLEALGIRTDEVRHTVAFEGRKYEMMQLLRPLEPFGQMHELEIRFACRRLAERPPA